MDYSSYAYPDGKVVRFSPQQQDIFRFGVERPTESAFIEAVAGSGKTTTLVHLCRYIPQSQSVAFMAYNTDIADEIGAKLTAHGIKGIESGTFHSFGFKAWRRRAKRVKVERDKIPNRLKAMIEVDLSITPYRSFVDTLVSLAKQKALGLYGSVDDLRQWHEIVEHHDMSQDLEGDNGRLPPGVTVERGINIAREVLAWSCSVAYDVINFDDMIYMPLITGCSFEPFDNVLVDESQDTNPARRAMVRAMLKPRTGRAMFVGDRYQGIYGFTGADADAVDLIMKEFNCVALPLTVTYRCPKAVVELAQTIVPHITAHESAPNGVVRDLEQAEDLLLKEKLLPTDAILCRKTAPIVSLAYRLLRRGVACHVEGRDIGSGLAKMLTHWKSITTLPVLLDRLIDYKEARVAKLRSKGRDTAAEALADQVDTLVIMCEGCSTVAEVEAKVASLFQDTRLGTRKPSVTLSTVHKAKGREWQRVFVYGGEKWMPSPWARQDWQKQQEKHLMYVAYTRSKEELVHAPALADEKKRGS